MAESIVASAPGSLMLFGEHAVLRGKRAVAGAVDARVEVRLTPRADDRVRIRSALGALDTRLDALDIAPPFTFLLAALLDARPLLKSGLELEVTAGFSSTVGLGSSAAVTAAALGALARHTGQPEDPGALLRHGVALIRRVQGGGSGTDLAASLHGGLIGYHATSLEVEPLPGLPPFTLVYSGAKEPTPKVIKVVDAWSAARPAISRALFDLIGQTTDHALAAIRAGDWAEVGALMTLHQGLQDAMGLTNRALGEVITALRAHPGVWGAKISGSGLGDCAIALGSPNAEVPGYERIPAVFAAEGLRVVGA